LEARKISLEEKRLRLQNLAERLENLSFSSEQKAWLQELLTCIEGGEGLFASSDEEVYEVYVCAVCGERFFFQRETYGPEERLLCPECGEAYSLPPKGDEKK